MKYFLLFLRFLGINNIFSYKILEKELLVWFNYSHIIDHVNEKKPIVITRLKNGLFNRYSFIDIVAQKIPENNVIKISVKANIYGKVTFGWDDENNREEYLLYLNENEAANVSFIKTFKGWYIKLKSFTVQNNSQQIFIEDKHFYFFHVVKNFGLTKFF